MSPSEPADAAKGRAVGGTDVVAPGGDREPVHVVTSAEHGITAGAARTRSLTSLISRSGAVVVLVLVLIVGHFTVSTFGTADNLRNVALSASFIAIIAAGMTFVIICGGIDLSVGSVYALAVIVSAYMGAHGSLAAVAVPLLCCAVVGLVQGSIIAYLRMPAFIVTLAGLAGVRGIVYYITGEGNDHPIITGRKSFETLGDGSFLSIGLPVWIALAVFAVGWWVLNRTSYGQAVQAIGGNAAAAELMGLPVRPVTTMVYVASALAAGLAGVLTTALSHGGQEARVGDGYELLVIAAVVIGGTLLTGGIGSMVGTLAGAALLFVIRNLIVQGMDLKVYHQQVVNGAFLLIVAVLQTVLSRRANQT